MKDEYSTLRAAFHAGATIQAWRLNGITKEQAISIAKEYAFSHGSHHSYVSEPFEPHEWVVEAIMEAANSIFSNDGRWDDLSTSTEPRFVCPDHLYRVKPEDAP